MTRGRTTIYRGIKMRSRLEASFAQHLDALALSWDYEPECFASMDGQYLPDFRVNTSGLTLYYEVKPPTADTGKALAGMHVIRSSEPAANLLVVVTAGIYPNHRWVTAGKCWALDRCGPCRGQPFTDERCVAGADRRVWSDAS